MSRSHKYIKKYRNSHGNWTYVYDLPKGRDDTRDNSNQQKGLTEENFEWYYATFGNGDNAKLTARRPDKWDYNYYGPGVHRRGEGLESDVSQRGVKRKQYHSVQDFIADAWKKKIRQKQRDERETAAINALFDRIDRERKGIEEKAKRERAINRKKQRVARDVEARERREKQEREKNLTYKARRKFAKSKQQIHYLDKDQETWANTFRAYENKVTHEQSKRAKSGRRRRVTK